MEKAETKGAAFDFYGKLPLTKAVPLGLQHVLAMFVGNLTPILIITEERRLTFMGSFRSQRQFPWGFSMCWPCLWEI